MIKGEPLSLLTYKENGCRKYNDTDILIDKSNLNNLETLLVENGYFTEHRTR